MKESPLPERLEMPNFTVPKNLDPTIYQTEAGVSSVSGRESELQMLSTAIKISLDPKRNVKVGPPQWSGLKDSIISVTSTSRFKMASLLIGFGVRFVPTQT